MHQAIERDLGRAYNCTFGQIWFEDANRKQGELRFDKLSLTSDLPNKKDAIKRLLKVIRPDELSKNFHII